ncbi:unnamed protein product [Amaranthus hypochondriacus]
MREGRGSRGRGGRGRGEDIRGLSCITRSGTGGSEIRAVGVSMEEADTNSGKLMNSIGNEDPIPEQAVEEKGQLQEELSYLKKQLLELQQQIVEMATQQTNSKGDSRDGDTTGEGEQAPTLDDSPILGKSKMVTASTPHLTLWKDKGVTTMEELKDRLIEGRTLDNEDTEMRLQDAVKAADAQHTNYYSTGSILDNEENVIGMQEGLKDDDAQHMDCYSSDITPDDSGQNTYCQNDEEGTWTLVAPSKAARRGLNRAVYSKHVTQGIR